MYYTVDSHKFSTFVIYDSDPCDIRQVVSGSMTISKPLTWVFYIEKVRQTDETLAKTWATQTILTLANSSWRYSLKNMRKQPISSPSVSSIEPEADTVISN